MRLAGVVSALKALEAEMQYNSAKLIAGEAADPKLIDCYQYDDQPLRNLLGTQLGFRV